MGRGPKLFANTSLMPLTNEQQVVTVPNPIKPAAQARNIGWQSNSPLVVLENTPARGGKENQLTSSST